MAAIKRTSSCDLRSAYDWLIFEKAEYGRLFKEMTTDQVKCAEAVLVHMHETLMSGADVLKKINRSVDKIKITKVKNIPAMFVGNMPETVDDLKKVR